MRKGLTVLTMLTLLAAVACTTQQPDSVWFEGNSFEAALEQAKAGDKLVLIDFYAYT